MEAAAGIADELQTLARYKFDGYEGYRPGTRFLESFVRWIGQFKAEDRAVAARFARTGIVYLSRAEIQHLVELVYPSIIRPALIRSTARRTGTPPHWVTAITASPAFAAAERATLVLGLSDGALLDQLRRLSPQLRHEQISLVPEVSDGRLAEMRQSLDESLSALGWHGDRRFGTVLLVDDFSATGTTLLRYENGGWHGRLWQARHEIDSLVRREALAADHEVRLVLYTATERTHRALEMSLGRAGLKWEVDVVHRIPDEVRVTADGHAELHDLCQRYDADEPGEASLALGCGGAALPVVLYHNTPDNSISLLWRDRSGDGGRGAGVVALFPRYERYPCPAPPTVSRTPSRP